MKKYIHYCWFGDKPLPKLAKKCLKSWQKYLPDFEVKIWNESNSNLDECPFVKEAFENKKWAFVADYVRSKAMYEMGGIYFDTDMEIIHPIDNLLKDDSFIGVEDSGYIACGVWYEAKPKSGLSKYLLDFYKKQKGFDINNTFEFSIPKLITNYLNEYGFVYGKNENQKLTNGTVVYSREYFYPLSYDRQNNLFTKNTCMIHYYDASWVPKSEKRDLQLVRIFGRNGAKRVVNCGRFVKRNTKKAIKIIGWPVYSQYRKKKNKETFDFRRNEFVKDIEKFEGEKYIAICNKYWLGTQFATEELFENVYKFHELFDGDDYHFYAQKIVDMKFKTIVFSAFSIGWKQLIEEIRKIDSKVTIKILWHGSNAMQLEEYDWAMFKDIFDLLRNDTINSIGFVKKSMYDYYNKLGYNVEFVMNTVHIDDKIKKEINVEKHKGVRIGLYASGNRWVKNFYNQLAGAALVKNSTIDVIPLNKRVKDFGEIVKANIAGSENNVPRKEMLRRLAQNDINLNCTFVECAPITPLESLELGVPCLTCNNHHYWEGTELEKYLVVDKADNSYEIYNRINYVLENKEKIMELYKIWKIDNDKNSVESVEKFLNLHFK